MYILPGALAPLAAYAQFILVQFVPRPGSAGKTDKHPVNPHTFMRHSAHDSAIWMDLSTACALAATMGDGWGVGFVITEADPFICLDLDNCLLPDRTWSPEALAMLAAFPGACEVSNSGSGLHVWGTYTSIPAHGKRNKMRNMELYSSKRFIALGSNASGAMHDLTATLPGFIASWFAPGASDDAEGGEWTTGPCDGYSPLTDDELITKALARASWVDPAAVFGGAAPMVSFADLWNRNVDVLSKAFPAQMVGKEFDGSEADFALAKDLAYWTGKDCARIERLMNLSALRRDKWLPSVHRVYFHDTVLNGVAACKQVHHVKPLVPVATPNTGRLAPKVIEHQTFIGRENMASLFDGCAYIQDLNAILIPNGDIVDQARFKARYAGYTFSMDNENAKTSKDAWDAYINNSVITFPRADGTVFEPRLGFQDVVDRSGRTWVNVYKDPAVIRKQGDVTPFMDLLHKLLPNGDDAIILLSYMAAVVQHRGTKFKWAPFVQGTQGNGKSTLTRCLRYALGNKYTFSVKASMIENDFNSWLENNVLYIADDIYTINDRANMMESLKSLITEEEHPITLKGVDSVQKNICGNFFFTDNHKDAMKKQDDTRRICTLYCAQQSKADRQRDGLTKGFFNNFYAWLTREGFEYVADMLHTMPIDPRYNPAGECQEAPDTSATQEAIVDGRTGIEHEVAEWIELEEPGFCGEFVSAVMLKRKMESVPRFAKSATYLKIKEMMGRLGYEIHRGLKDGRCVVEVQPDGSRPVLYVRRDSAMAELKGAADIGRRYSEAQQAAINAAISRRLQNVNNM